jgi:hypothetical protein
MHAAWVGFATSGDPGWPKYELGRGGDALRFDLEVVFDPGAGNGLFGTGRVELFNVSCGRRPRPLASAVADLPPMKVCCRAC